jgi:curved DNA-binding protein CbpA
MSAIAFIVLALWSFFPAGAVERLPQWGNRTYYQILGVPEKAKAEQIRQAFRVLAMKYHPDRNPGRPAAEEEFKAVAAAWEVLGDAAKKSAYDLRSRGSKASSATPPAPSTEEALMARIRIVVEAYGQRPLDDLAVDDILRRIESLETARPGALAQLLEKHLMDQNSSGLLVKAAVKYWLLRRGEEGRATYESFFNSIEKKRTNIQHWLLGRPSPYFPRQSAHLRRQFRHLEILERNMKEMEERLFPRPQDAGFLSRLRSACREYLKRP